MNPSHRICGNLQQGTCYIPAGSVPIAVQVGNKTSKPALKPNVTNFANKNDGNSNDQKVDAEKYDLQVEPHKEYQDYTQRATLESLFAETERKLAMAVNVKSTPPLHQKVTANVMNSTSALTKIQLILVLQKFQSLGVSYNLLSQFFNSVLGEQGFFPSILVFDDQTLTNSSSCYSSALAAINKTRSTDYSPLANAVEGLMSIVAAFK